MRRLITKRRGQKPAVLVVCDPHGWVGRTLERAVDHWDDGLDHHDHDQEEQRSVMCPSRTTWPWSASRLIERFIPE
jgi:hypothetical protein